MASASWCTETDGKINSTKLRRLLVDGGTQAARSVFNGIHPPSSLKATLTANRATLQRLRRPKGKVLNNEQWDILYPPSGSNPKSEDFDITLLFVLLKSICGLTTPATGWDALPPVTDNSLEANLARIKYYRNNTIAHKANTEINDVDFEQHWQGISSALLSLGLSQDDIDDLKSAPLGKKDYYQLLKDWYVSDKDIKTKLEEVKSETADIKSDTADIKSDTADIKSDTADIKSDTADIKSDTADIKSDTADIKSDTADIKSDTADIKSDTADIKEKLDDIQARKMDQPFQKLAYSDFKAEITTKCKAFHPSTRQWILDQVKSHVVSDQPDSFVMLIIAGPGMGKSTIAAKLCQTYQDLGCLAGSHFFQFSNATRNNPRLMLQSIARQMANTVPGYREALERKLKTDLGKKISGMNCEELLTILLEEPLCGVEQPDSNVIVVVDALDECSHDLKYELLKALSEKLPCFPSWLRFVLTSRPSSDNSTLRSTAIVKIRPEDQSNLEDLETFLNSNLESHYPQHNDNQATAQALVQTTKGLFLVACFIIDHMKQEQIYPPARLIGLFPKGISSVYEKYFSRLKEILQPYILEEERFFKMLEAIVATKSPVPRSMLYEILGLKSERDISRPARKTRKEALTLLHLLFPVMDGGVTPFHKTVFEWLIKRDEDEDHDFSVHVEGGKEFLARFCLDVLSDIRDGKKDLDTPLNLSPSERYALKFGLPLIIQSSTVTADEKKNLFSNFFCMTAYRCQHTCDITNVSTSEVKCQSLPSFWAFSETIAPSYQDSIEFNCGHKGHQSSCPFSRFASFGHYLKFVAQLCHAMGMPVFWREAMALLRIPAENLSPRPIDIVTEYHLPYFETRPLLEVPLKEIRNKIGFTAEVSDVYHVKKNLISICISSFSLVDGMPSFTVLKTYPLDGKITNEKWYEGELIRTCISPNKKFIVVTNGKKIEILDAATLEVVHRYGSSHDIETCHVFGNDQSWFIVIKCRHDKVYVLEGLTGRLHNTIKVAEGSYVEGVSVQGHIVVIRTWTGKETDKMTFTDQNGNTRETMNWAMETVGGNYDKAKPFFFQEMSIYNDRMLVPVYTVKNLPCQCYDVRDYDSESFVLLKVRFSADGRLLAYSYKGSIFIVNTTDGSLYQRIFLCPEMDLLVQDTVFVSERHLLVGSREMVLFAFDVQTGNIQHTVCFPQHLGLDLTQVTSKDWEEPVDLIVRNLKERGSSTDICQLTIRNLELRC